MPVLRKRKTPNYHLNTSSFLSTFQDKKWEMFTSPNFPLPKNRHWRDFDHFSKEIFSKGQTIKSTLCDHTTRPVGARILLGDERTKWLVVRVQVRFLDATTFTLFGTVKFAVLTSDPFQRHPYYGKISWRNVTDMISTHPGCVHRWQIFIFNLKSLANSIPRKLSH
jgi:hypothetical protein